MGRKSSEPPPVPPWIVSYGDMMSLLLCFFIMLVAMSEIRDDEQARFRQVLQSLKEAFGYSGGVGVMPSEEAPENSLLVRLEQLDPETFTLKKGNASDEGIDGRQNTVKRIREGIEFTIGGGVGFDAGSAELKDDAKRALREMTRYLRGENNKIEVRGHSTRSEAGEGSPFPDEHRLAYARAATVAEFLVDQGVKSERIRRVDCGSSEPLVLRAYDEQTKTANRRVEIIVTQSLTQEFEGGEGETLRIDPATPPPGSPVAAGQSAQGLVPQPAAPSESR